jgi:hypothetical protein
MRWITIRAALAAVLAVVLTAVAGPAARADVVFDNIFSENALGDDTGSVVGAAILTGDTALLLTSVAFPQVLTPADPGETFSVASRNPDGTVGATLFTAFSLSGGFGPFGIDTKATATSPYVLQSHTGYWFVLTAPAGGQLDWDYSSSPDYTSAYGVSLPASRVAFDITDGVTAYYDLSDGPQFMRVEATAVPEPSGLTLCTLGTLIGAGCWYRSPKAGTRARRPAS